MDSKATLKAGDVCVDCQERDLEKYLRYFKINLNGDTILKCESNECMYPYKDELLSDDEENSAAQFMETSSLRLIDDLIQKYNNEDELQNKHNILQNTETVNEQVTHFDITFLDDLNEVKNENVCQSEIAVRDDEYLYNKFNVLASTTISLPTFNSTENEISSIKVKETNDDLNDNKFSVLNLTGDNINDCLMEYQQDNIIIDSNDTHDGNNDSKSKIDIQSIETIKFESVMYNDLPTSSTNFPILKDYLTKNDTCCDTVKLNDVEPSNSNKKMSKSGPMKIKANRKFKTEAIPRRTPVKTSVSKQFEQVDIPKADIIKGNALLKKLAVMDFDKKPLKFNSPKDRNKKAANNSSSKKQDKPTESSSSFSTSSDGVRYTFDKISEMLLRRN